jgi:hypothetical protein
MKAPAARRSVLVFLAGLVWSVVGLVLMIVAAGWLKGRGLDAIPEILIGMVGGIIVFYFGFSKLAKKNLTRIYEQAPGKDKVCLFAFQNRRSYLTVAVMILMGYTLRHSGLPRIYLSPIYLTIGLGLFLAGGQYFERLRHQ